MNSVFADREYDVCIIGAGVAGAALASRLGKAGARVALIEKQWQAPDRIVGELLQPDGVRQLTSLGLDHILKHIDAQAVKGYAIFLDGERITVEYPEVDGKKVFGYGLKNQLLLQKLREEVCLQPSVCIISSEAKMLMEENNTIVGVHVEHQGAKSYIRAKLTVVSDGFYSKLRKGIHAEDAEVTGWFLGMKLYNTRLPFEGFGHVFVNDKVKFLAYPIGTGVSRILIERKDNALPLRSTEMKVWLHETVKPVLPESMYSHFEQAIEEGNFKIMPNQLLPAHVHNTNGVVLLGDALNMRNPLTGGGMTVALTDVSMLSELLTDTGFETQTSIYAAVDKFYHQHSCNATINILADALNRVFTDTELAHACFSYLKQGGEYASEPLGLLAGLNRSQSLLLEHFFAVALHGAAAQVRENGPIKGISKAKQMMGNATRIVSPLILNEEQTFIARHIFKAAQKIAS